uniref:Uncharacterized protein n=1 Tax=Timema bartmani TaxID=61472 RepID=A0A7R9I704_9NEOP|nr:unnamed protein product [Timema bartmani]
MAFKEARLLGHGLQRGTLACSWPSKGVRWLGHDLQSGTLALSWPSKWYVGFVMAFKGVRWLGRGLQSGTLALSWPPKGYVGLVVASKGVTHTLLPRDTKSSALYCYNCGSIMSMKGGCDNAANKKLVTLEKCQPNVKRCFNLKTSTDKTVSRGCLTEAVDYYCTGLGYCETCQGDFCNGNTNFHSGLAKLFKFAKEA